MRGVITSEVVGNDIKHLLQSYHWLEGRDIYE